MARVASALSPAVRINRPQRVARNAQNRIGARTRPSRNSTLTRSAERTCGTSLHQPKSIAGNRGAVGSISGLPRKNARPVPNNISAMPTATSFTRGSEQMPACSAPSRAPVTPAARTPSQGEPLRYEIPEALIAPITRVPSRPRLMRPLRSVMHSPRLTNRNGVLTRIAPPRTASGTVHNPIEPSAMSRGSLSGEDWQAAIKRVARQHGDEDHPLQHQDGRIRQAEAPLQEPTARADSAEQNSDRNDGERIVPRQERHQDSGKAIACR